MKNRASVCTDGKLWITRTTLFDLVGQGQKTMSGNSVRTEAAKKGSECEALINTNSYKAYPNIKPKYHDLLWPTCLKFPSRCSQMKVWGVISITPSYLSYGPLYRGCRRACSAKDCRVRCAGRGHWSLP